MASMATTSVFFLLLSAFAAGANAATFNVTNKCSFTVWPAAFPVGGGLQLDPTQTWTLNVPAGTSSGRIWGRTGCSFNGTSGHCSTGDCAGELSCTVSGQPPATLAEFSIGSGAARDLYDIAVVDGFNLAIAFSCSTGVGLVCKDATCPDAFPNNANGGGTATSCSGNSNYQVTFCP